MNNKSKKDKPIIFDDDLIDTCKAASATDCTGLIQSTPMNDDEYESYRDIYDFTPPVLEFIDDDEVLKDIKSNIMVANGANIKPNTSDLADDEKKYSDVSDVFDCNDINDAVD